MRSIKCVNNEKDISLTFSETGFTPFFLASVDGIYSAKNNVFMSENVMVDGATYQDSIAPARNIVISLIENPQGNFIYDQSNRDLLYSLFRKGDEGTLYYEENGVVRKIKYYPESITRANKGSRLFTISLLCANPRFNDESDTYVAMANWYSSFEFTHEFVASGEVLGYRSAVRLVNIVNDKSMDKIGMTIIIEAQGNVVNPVITRIESGEHIALGSEDNPFSLQRGDVLTITTMVNNKHITLAREGVVSEVNLYLTEDSEFIQLMYGNNNIVYDADEGRDNMTVNIIYANEYEGV